MTSLIHSPALALFLLAFFLASCTEPDAPLAPQAPAAPSTVGASPTTVAPTATPAPLATPFLRLPLAVEDSAKPFPVTPALEAPFAYGVASGDVTADRAVLWTRTPGAAEVTAELSETPGFESPVRLPAVRTAAERDFTAKVLATGLTAGTQYRYRFRSGSDVSPVGSFRTAYAPTQRAKVTLGFTGDADWKWKPYPILRSLAQEKLDLFVFLGDLIYETRSLRGNTVAEDLNEYRFKYRENREPVPWAEGRAAPMRDLYGAFGQYSVVDNHELGGSLANRGAPPYTEGGAQIDGQFVNRTPGFTARMQAYAEYNPVRDETVQGTGDPRSDGTGRFYRVVPWGSNVELIVLDGRSYRDRRLSNSDHADATSCARTMLGAPQVQWLQRALLAARDRKAVWKVVVSPSPIQQLGRASQIGHDRDGDKSWPGGYACERDRLLKFVADNGIDNVVFLTTDNHYTVINNLMYRSVPEDPSSPLKPVRNALEILTGPMGAGAGVPPGMKVDVTGLSQRDADRRILAAWNGDEPTTDGQTKGLKQAGLDPIGLEASFPGLVASSIRAAGVAPGTVDPLAFVSFRTYTYAVLSFDEAVMSVQVKGFPIVADPTTLLDPQALREYEGRQAQEILTFQVQAPASR